jgi:hypothetical protein
VGLFGRWVENTVCADNSAAELLCEYAHLEYAWDTAELIARAIAKGESYLLSDSTNARLRQYNRGTLRALAEDVLD